MGGEADRGWVRGRGLMGKWGETDLEQGVCGGRGRVCGPADK
jgi:hypothetical protein